MDGILATVRVRLFGAVGIEQGDALDVLPIERPMQLLVYLACAGDWVDRDRLAALFWPDHEAESAHRNVRKLLHRLGHSKWGGCLDIAGTQVRSTTDCDVAAFDRAIAAADLARAHNLYRGVLAPRFELGAPASYAQWLQTERVRRAQQHRDTVLQIIGQQPPAAERHRLATVLMAIDALDEQAALACAQAQIDLGQHAAAAALLREHAARVGGELAIEPSPQLRALLRVATVPADLAGPPVGPAVARDALVGRRAELRWMLARVAESPVVTLHGPGGVGKSRLARAAVERLADDLGWRWPPHWVPLADVADADSFVDTLAAQLGVPLGDAAQPWSVMLEFLRARPMLLVLDNAETVSELPKLLAELREACVDVRLLITSRVRLHLEAEDVIDLEGLPWPDEEDATDVEVASCFDAVALFGARAAAAEPGFDLGRHIAGVVDVVRMLRGLPLAIELAAAWVRLLPPREIAAEIAASINILERTADGCQSGDVARPEHTSLRATLERSWALLAPRERDALAALSAMHGGFGHDAARAVTGAALPVLASLVDKSLVQADQGRARFDLHPLVQAFARERAQRQPAAAAAATARHAGWFAGWLQRIAPQARTDVSAFNAAVATELGNLARAWSYAAEARDAATLAEMANPLANYFENSGRYREGCDWLTLGLPAGEPTPVRQKAAMLVHRGLGTLSYRLGAHEKVERHARETVRLARLSGDTTSLKAALNISGLSLWQRNRFAEAARYFEAALKQAERDGDQRGIGVFTANLAMVARENGEFDRSLSLLMQAHAMAVERDEHRSVTIGCNNIGNHHRLFGAWDEALRWLHQGLAMVERHGLDGLRASLTVNIGLVELGRGDLDAARVWLERTCALEGRGAEPYLLIAARFGMAQVLIRRGQFDAARATLAGAVLQARAERTHFHELEAIVVLAEWRAARGEKQRAGALLGRLLAEPALDATLRVEAQRALADLGQSPPDDVGAMPISLVASLDALVAGVDPPGCL